jgi:hypothetical protein
MKENVRWNPQESQKSLRWCAMPTPARTEADGWWSECSCIRKVGQLNLTISLVKCTSVCLINCERRTTL